MQASTCFLVICLLLLSSFSSLSVALSLSEASFIARRQPSSLKKNVNLPDYFELKIELNITFPNPRLRKAYIALQAWKKAIRSDPLNITGNWEGLRVCDYNGVFCAPALDDPKQNVVAGIDLNHFDIVGYLPVELGLLTDIALFHVNSNRFSGIIPKSFSRLTLLHELDVSNNRLVGPFPEVVMSLPSLKYLDIRYNDFEGGLPPEVFEKDLDALFLNNNRFTSTIPETLGSSPASVVVIANNKLTGCIPSSIGKMGSTLNEFIFLNNSLSGCLPSEIGKLGNATVLDVGSNLFSGVLPRCFEGLSQVERLDVSHNLLTGFVPQGICKLPNLVNFTFSYNYFNGEAQACSPPKRKDIAMDDTSNCLPDRPKQKSPKICHPVVRKPVDCNKAMCGGSQSSSSLPKPPAQPSPSPKAHPPKDSTWDFS
ncbi:hypothetical protein D5086_025557 [Populus alba]|uniref:Uncharacterized protein n=1 Tax=Populus alba TaxID=43335 RepID=A0ACC4B1A9_POPAL